jgi:hypothetical protein
MFASEENTQIVRVRHFATHSVIQVTQAPHPRS